MPMLADLTDPPSPRTRGLLLGVAVGVPIVAVVALWLLPMLHAQLVGGAGELDARLRLEDAYLGALCHDALVVERDEALCGCVLATEVPSLDCRSAFMEWSLARQDEQCRSAEVRAAALGFCSCVETLAQRWNEAEDEREARRIAQRYARCAELEDARFLPALEELAPAPAQVP